MELMELVRIKLSGTCCKYHLVKGHFGPRKNISLIKACLAYRIRIWKNKRELRSMGEKRKTHIHHLHPPFSHLWDSLHQTGNNSSLVTPIELILVPLESLRISLQFAYMD